MMNDRFLDLHPSDPAWGHAYGPGAGGVRLHYVRMGQGSPVVLLHGWPGFWYDYRRLLPVLAQDADVIAPDFRGYGDSDRPDLPAEAAYMVSDHVADILALLDSLGLERVTQVGHDIGSVVAQAIARQAPERVAALALFNPSYGGIGKRRYDPAVLQDFWYQYFHNLPWADELISYNRDTVRLYLAHFYDHWVTRKEALRPAEFEAIVDTYARPGAAKASIQWYRGRAAARAKEATADPASLQVDSPAFVAWGEHDPVFPVAWSDRLSEYFSDLRSFRRLPGVGHFVVFEAVEEALETIRQALKHSLQG